MTAPNDTAAALDVLIAAVRADVPPEVREAMSRVKLAIAERDRKIGPQLDGEWVTPTPPLTWGDLRALARHGGAT